MSSTPCLCLVCVLLVLLNLLLVSCMPSCGVCPAVVAASTVRVSDSNNVFMLTITTHSPPVAKAVHSVACMWHAIELVPLALEAGTESV